ncbi:hypothetical protein AAMO2058_000038000 [Amorphochlora amoebiformis]
MNKFPQFYSLSLLLVFPFIPALPSPSYSLSSQRVSRHMANRAKNRVYSRNRRLRSIRERCSSCFQRQRYPISPAAMGMDGGDGDGDGKNRNNFTNPPPGDDDDDDSDDSKHGQASYLKSNDDNERMEEDSSLLDDPSVAWAVIPSPAQKTGQKGILQTLATQFAGFRSRLRSGGFASRRKGSGAEKKRKGLWVSAMFGGVAVGSVLTWWPELHDFLSRQTESQDSTAPKKKKWTEKLPKGRPLINKASRIAEEIYQLGERGQVLKAKALMEANSDLTFTPEDQATVDEVLKRAEDVEAVLADTADDSGWIRSYDNAKERFKTFYKHESGETVHGIKMKAIFNASATSVLAVLREFDLTKTWNDHMKGAAQLGFPSAVSMQAYGAGFMPWGPFKVRDVLFIGHGVDALDEHGCIALVFQSSKSPLCALPPIARKCVRAEFLRSGVIIEPIQPLPGAPRRVIASMVLYGDPKMAVPGWLASFGLSVFAPTVKRQTDDLLMRMESNPESPYRKRQSQFPELYAMLDERVEDFLENSPLAPPKLRTRELQLQ